MDWLLDQNWVQSWIIEGVNAITSNFYSDYCRRLRRTLIIREPFSRLLPERFGKENDFYPRFDYFPINS